jgi:protein TonB
VLLIVGGAIALVLLIAFVMSQLSALNAPPPATLSYSIQPYNPPAQLISASDHVVAYEKPDLRSASVVMFGQGIALNVTGRVSTGIGNDWYAIAWNGGVAFVRQQDVVSGAPVAPPITAPRVPQPPPPENLDTSTDTTQTPEPPQAGPPPDLTGLRWLHRPTQRDFQSAYPQRALNDGVNGHVSLQCTAAEGGWLDCSVSDENPRGYGFGAAALELSRKFRLEPTSPDGRSVAGGRVEVPVEFRSN